jgi:hypothetical protein
MVHAKQKSRQHLGSSFPSAFIILSFFSLLLSFSGQAQAEQVSLAWDPNTEPELDGYKLYYGTASGSYSQVINVGQNTQVTVSNLSRGVTYFFAVTAFNLQGAESDFSNEIEKTMLPQYRLTVTKRGSGDGLVQGEGITCGDDCTGWYEEGTQVTLIVNPEEGSEFVGWSGDDCSGLGECTLTLNSDKALVAKLVIIGSNITKKNRNLKGLPLLAGAGSREDRFRRPKGIQNDFNTGGAIAGSSGYVIVKRKGLRERNALPAPGLKQEAVLRIRQAGI